MAKTSSDTTTSPTPISPFAASSVVSETDTSDGPPDLGDLSFVFHQLRNTQLQHRTNYITAAVSNRSHLSNEPTTPSSGSALFPSTHPELSSTPSPQPFLTVPIPIPSRADGHVPLRGANAEQSPAARSENNTLLCVCSTSSADELDSLSFSPSDRSPSQIHSPFSHTQARQPSQSPPPSRMSFRFAPSSSYPPNSTLAYSTPYPTSGHIATTESETLDSTSPQSAEPDLSLDDELSLGGFSEALSFLASERGTLLAKIDSALSSPSRLASRRHVIEPRRRRRRKRTKAPSVVTSDAPPEAASVPRRELLKPSARDAHDSDISSTSSYSDLDAGLPSQSVPASPPRRILRKPGHITKPYSNVSFSRSTPAFSDLGPPTNTGVDALCDLAHHLRIKFPDDFRTLSAVSKRNRTDVAVNPRHLFEPRGRTPTSQDPIIHVFIDHSNILFGFVAFTKRTKTIELMPRNRRPLHRHMSYAALSLILERGRPIYRRVMVASLPLYQPMESAEALGYEVRKLVLVEDDGEGDDRGRSRAGHRRGRSHNGSIDLNIGSKSRKSGAGTDSDANTGYSAVGSLPRQTPMHGDPPTGASPRAKKYREQGVDELLQLKLHQALADVDGDGTPPNGSTIVLATGDGNVGQFNPEGFIGVVRTALKKGWRVELYAWKDGLSRAWMREFGEGPFKDKFSVFGLEEWAKDLLET